MFKMDDFITKTHDMKSYNCWDFIRDVYYALHGEDIGYRTPLSGSRKEMKLKFTREEAEFRKLESPEEGSIVLFRRNKMLPHVGVYIKGKVLHLPEGSSARYENLEIAGLGFKQIGFYKCKK